MAEGRDEIYTKDVPALSPRLVGGFSLDLSDGELKYHPDARHLEEIIDNLDKSVAFDLNLSMDKVIRRDQEKHSQMKLESILKWILNKYKWSGPPVDIVSPIGVLAKVMRSSYKPEKTWTILATKFRDTIYLKKEENETVLERGSQHEVASSWGLKFEQFMSKGSDPREGCDENEAHYCVVRSELASHSLLYRAEVDVVDYSYKPQTVVSETTPSCNPPAELEDAYFDHKLPHGLAHFVELKTTKEYSWRGLPRFKSIDWWSKAYLGGRPRIVCGIKNENGIVKSLKTYQAESLVTSSECKNMTLFLNTFLDYAKKNIVEVEDNPRVVYQIRIDRGQLSSRRLDDRTTCLLTQEYIDTLGGTGGRVDSVPDYRAGLWCCVVNLNLVENTVIVW